MSRVNAIISERSHSPAYKIEHFLTIEGVKSRFAKKETFQSKSFSCAEEQGQTEFAIRLGFGESERNRKGLSVYLLSENRDVFVKECTITIVDVHLKKQNATTFRDTLIKKMYGMTGIGGDALIDLTNTSFPDDTLCVQTEFIFVGASSNAMNNSLFSRDTNFEHDFRVLFSDPSETDVSIVVGTKKFRAHKLILKARSSYFRTLFESGMAETRTNEVVIEDADPDVFKHLLEFLYTGYPPNRLIEEAWELLPLADRFGVLTLKSKCERAIGSYVSEANALKAVSLAHAHCCSSLIEKCLPLIRKNLKSLKATEEWKEIRKNADLIALVLESYAE